MYKPQQHLSVSIIVLFASFMLLTVADKAAGIPINSTRHLFGGICAVFFTLLLIEPKLFAEIVRNRLQYALSVILWTALYIAAYSFANISLDVFTWLGGAISVAAGIQYTLNKEG